MRANAAASQLHDVGPQPYMLLLHRCSDFPCRRYLLNALIEGHVLTPYSTLEGGPGGRFQAEKPLEDIPVPKCSLLGQRSLFS